MYQDAKDEKAKLAAMTAECVRLRKVLAELDAQAAEVDGQLVKIERKLPDQDTAADERPADER